MERKQFQPTEKQIAKWNALKPAEMPTDDEFKAAWKRGHHNVETGWGMEKRDWIINHKNDHLTETVEYNLGLWQGRLDALQGLAAIETPDYHNDPFQYGYFHGFSGFESFWRGYDAQARVKLIEQYNS